MRKSIVILTCLVVFTLATAAQEYKTGFGFRGGLSNGLTIKHFIGSDIAVEGLMTARYKGWNITGLYEIHTEPFNVNNLYFYYGLGGHIGSWQTMKGKPWWDDTEMHSVIGIDGIIGLEYNFLNVPFSVSLDWKPGLNIIGYPKFWGDELSLSVRYVWGSR